MAHETCGYFGDMSCLYGMLHHANGSANGAVLFIPPFGEERKCVYRVMVNTARELATMGLTVLRFDYRGTGDSHGAHNDATMDCWLEDIATAVATLRTEVGATVPITAIGVRLGANLAIRSPALAGESLLLWEPLLSGSDYLRELIRRKQLKEAAAYGAAQTDPKTVNTCWNTGNTVDLDGFDVNGRLANQLGKLDLATDLHTAPASRILILHITGAKRFTAPWQTIQHDMGSLPQRHIARIADKPFWGALQPTVSRELVDATLQFCRS